MLERRTAELFAGTIALRAGLDPFEAALAAGIADATRGNLFGESRRTHYGRNLYKLGFELGRYARLDCSSTEVPSEAEAAAIVERLETLPC